MLKKKEKKKKRGGGIIGSCPHVPVKGNAGLALYRIIIFITKLTSHLRWQA